MNQPESTNDIFSIMPLNTKVLKEGHRFRSGEMVVDLHGWTGANMSGTTAYLLEGIGFLLGVATLDETYQIPLQTILDELLKNAMREAHFYLLCLYAWHAKNPEQLPKPNTIAETLKNPDFMKHVRECRQSKQFVDAALDYGKTSYLYHQLESPHANQQLQAWSQITGDKNQKNNYLIFSFYRTYLSSESNPLIKIKVAIDKNNWLKISIANKSPLDPSVSEKLQRNKRVPHLVAHASTSLEELANTLDHSGGGHGYGIRMVKTMFESMGKDKAQLTYRINHRYNTVTVSFSINTALFFNPENQAD